MAQRTLYFKGRTPAEITTIITRAGELAQALGVGTAADDLLAAAVSGKLTLTPNTPIDLSKPPQLTLTQALDRAAAEVQEHDPALAEELRKRVWLLAAALG